MFVRRRCWILVLGLWLFQCGVEPQDSFYFNPQPQDQSVVSGHTVTLECGVSNAKHIVFYWTLNGETVQNSTRRFQNGSNLYITRADRRHDLGEFKCIAMNVSTGISLASQMAQLNILWIGETASVQLHTAETETKLREGGEMSLRCKVDGNPDVRFEWFYNGLRMFRSERVSFRNKRLHVTGLTAADNGIYSCRALNEAGSVDSSDNFPLILPSPNAARITKLPHDLTVKKNDSAYFDCIYENAASIEWYVHEKDVPLANNSRYTVYTNGSLLINNVRHSDEGIFRCVGISSISKDAPQQTYIAHLSVAFLHDLGSESFEPKPTFGNMAVVPRNSQYEVTCVRPSGHPKPKLWWEDPNQHIVSDTGRIRVDDSRLIVDGAKKSDNGNYTCIVENMANQKRHTVMLMVSSPPTITLHPVDVMVDEGELGALTCEFSGSPFPVTRVQWLKDDKLIQGMGHFVVNPQNGTLLINKTGTADSGIYVCEVNTTGFDVVRSKGANVFVKEKLKFVSPPGNTRLELGSNRKIYCKARASTSPVVRWIRDGHPFFEWPTHIHDENGTLIFQGVQNQDAGKYTCIATNSQGIINTTIQVDVVVMPKFTTSPVNTSAYEGYSTMLHCKASGDPVPTIQWDKNGALNVFDQKRFHVMTNGTLFVSEIHKDDQGKYGCTAGNSGGLKRVEVTLIVYSAENYSPNHIGSTAEQSESTMTKTITITLGAAAVYMLLVLGLMVWCRLRRAKRKALLLAQATAEVAKSENGDVNHEAEMKENATPRDGLIKENGIRSDGDAHSHSSGSHQSKRSRTSYDRLQFPRHDLQKMMLLGRGEFGDVFLAKGHGIRDSESETIVMVKSLQTKDENLHFEYKREMDMFHKLKNDNISHLLGVCRDQEPFMVILEYSDWGDLKQFLLATRKDNQRKGPRPPPLSLSQIIAICHQVAFGMEYLSNHRFTHRDLATRNCLITSRLDVKISSPSLSRDTYAKEYYRYQNKAVPLRWAPSEAILEDEWSTKSDVWSFAVLVWEMFTQADLPFADKADEALLNVLRNQELKWVPPDGSPDKLRELLIRCWNANPKDRPSFSDAVVRIGELTVDSHV